MKLAIDRYIVLEYLTFIRNTRCIRVYSSGIRRHHLAPLPIDALLNGHILQAAAEVIGAGKISEEQARNLFEKADADRSGAIDYGEFKQVQQENP